MSILTDNFYTEVIGYPSYKLAIPADVVIDQRSVILMMIDECLSTSNYNV